MSNQDTNVNSGFIAVVKREFARIFESKSMFMLSFIFPIIMIVLFGFFFKKGDVTGIKIAVVDYDKSDVSRLITRYLASAPTIKIESEMQSLESARYRLVRGEIDGIYFFPQDMTKDIKKGLSAKSLLYINTTILVKSNYLYRDGFQITKTASAGVLLQKLRKAGLSEKQSMAIVSPVTVDAEPLFNPYINYSGYLFPSLAIVTLQTLVMMLSVLMISKERNEKTFSNLIRTANGNALNILAGKAVPHIIIHFLNAAVILYLLLPLFNVPIIGSLAVLYLYVCFFLLTVFMVGFMIGTLLDDHVRATEVSLFINIPAFIFSGLTFPLWGMPALHNYYAKIIPFTHFAPGFLKILLMDAPVKYLAPELTILSGYLVVSFVVSLIVLTIKIRRTEKAELNNA